MGSSVNIALPTIGKEFGLDAVTLGWVATSFMLASAITLLPAGRLADIHGRKRMFASGSVVFGLASLVIAFAPSAAVLLAARVVQGIGAAMVFGTSVAILTSVYPANEKGRVLGINVASVYIGQSVGPTIGGILTRYFGWRSIFLVVAPVALLIFVITITKLRGEWAEARNDSFDVPGALIYALSLFGVIYGLSALPSALGAMLIGGGVVCFIAFVAWERRTLSPLLNLKLFSNNPVFTFSNAAALINYCANAATALLLSLYLQHIKGYPPQTAGLILIAQPVVQAIFSPLAGRLSDTVEPRILASAGMACAALGLFLFATLAAETPVVFVVAVLMLLGAGFALFSSPNTNAIMSSVEKRSYGVAAATLSTMRVIGQTMSIGIVMLVFALVIGRVAIAPENYGALMASTRVLFSMFAVLCVSGIFFSLARGNVR
jgi:EmrB/QacA subfamily drug resistance transporter